MAAIYDERTSFLIGDPSKNSLDGTLPSPADIKAALSPLILSASGWRKVFAVSGDEEDRLPDIGGANAVLAVHMANVFADFLIAGAKAGTKPELVVGLDSRPTGTVIGDLVCRVFLARGFTVHYIFIAAAPEIMAYARGIGAFAYVSASHNPIGHNGVKFGLDDGGVLPGSAAGPLIAAFRAAVGADNASQKAQTLLASCDAPQLETLYRNVAAEKKRALASYASFSREVISGETDTDGQTFFFESLKKAVDGLQASGKPVSLVADFNGSARGLSIDRNFFEAHGIALFGMNEAPRQIVHRIVPEGDSLSYCAREIERLHAEGQTATERNATMGYVPDCDGDRGNIVYWNERKGKAEIMEAQEVFALSVIAELAHQVFLGKTEKLAVAVNDPTSLRIEAIGASFGARVARAEVGEANVVNLARALRSEGYLVRILGEGSNGGNITHPAAVRDPLNTVFAILKLLIIRDAAGQAGLFHLWCAHSGQEEKYRADFTLADVMATLPAYVTTSVFEKDAMLTIRTRDHAALKRKFQAVFEREWTIQKPALRDKYAIASYIAISNNGTAQTDHLTDFGLSGSGGLKIQFLDESGQAVAFIWMRGSGTEPVFRILADAKGSDVSFERELLAWLTGLVLEADGKIE